MKAILQQSDLSLALCLDEDRKAIVVEYIFLAKSIARMIWNHLPHHIELEDLEHAGILGLIEAVWRYDKNQKIQFKTYAQYRIRGAILDDLRKNDWMTRTGREKCKLLKDTVNKLEKQHQHQATTEEISQTLGMRSDAFFDFRNDAKGGKLVRFEEVANQKTYAELDETQAPALIEKNIWLGQVKILLSQEIDKLKHDERLVLSLYYYEALTMKEIGLVLNLSESRISQIHDEVMVKLSRHIKKE